jgi:hypothetical protein
MIRVFALALLLSAGALSLSGCATSEPQDPDRVSTIPWNRPERWEGQGALGGFAPSTN